MHCLLDVLQQTSTAWLALKILNKNFSCQLSIRQQLLVCFIFLRESEGQDYIVNEH